MPALAHICLPVGFYISFLNVKGESYHYTYLNTLSLYALLDLPTMETLLSCAKSSLAGFDLSSSLNTVFEEQNYAKLKILLQDLRDIDKKSLAAKIGISIPQLKKNLQDRASFLLFSLD